MKTPPYIICVFFIFCFGFETVAAQFTTVNQTGHAGKVTDAAFSPDGACLFTIGDDNKLLNWDLQSSRHYAPVGGLQDEPGRIFFINNEEYLITTTKYSVYRGNVHSNELELTERSRFPMARVEACRSSAEFFLAFRPWQTGEHPLLFYYPNRKKNARYFECENAKEVLRGEIQTMHFEPFNRKLFIGDDKSNLYVMDCETRMVQLIHSYKEGTVTNISASPYGLAVTVANKKTKYHRLIWHEFTYPKNKITRTKILNSNTRPNFLKYSPLENKFIYGSTLADSFYTTLVYFSSPEEYKESTVLWHGNRNKPVTAVALNPVHKIMAMFAFGHIHYIWETHSKQVIQNLENQVMGISQFAWDKEQKQLYIFSEKDSRYSHIDMQNAEVSDFELSFPGNAVHYLSHDGTFYIHNKKRNKLLKFLPDGSSDSIDYPFGPFFEFYVSEKNNTIIGYGNEEIIILDALSLKPLSRYKATLGMLSGEFGLTPDEGFIYITNIELGRDDKIEVISAKTGKLVNTWIMEKLAPDSIGIVTGFYFIDSNARRLVCTQKLHPDMHYSYNLVVAENKESGKILKNIQLNFRADKILPGRTKDELIVATKPLEWGGSFLYKLNLKTLILDSLPIPQIKKLTSINWLDSSRLWILSDANEAYFLGKSGELKLYSLDKKDKKYFFTAQPGGFTMVSETGEMLCKKGSSNLISFDIKTGDKTQLIPGSNLEVFFNKPHEVLMDIGSKDTLLLNTYEKAWKKRLKRFGEMELANTSDLPIISIPFETGTLYTSNPDMELSIQFYGKSSPVERLIAEHNGCPINEYSGILPEYFGTLKLHLVLVAGVNRFLFYVQDAKGRNSIAIYKEIFLTTSPVKSKLYVIGIGVSKYRDSSNNLVFAAKDIRDVIGWAKSQSSVMADTFIDESAVWENILEVKKKLKALSPSDKVIIYFSGHGMLDKKLDLYLALHKMDFSDPTNGGLRLDDLISLFDSTPALHRLLLIDACHSGELDKEEVVLAEGNGNVGEGAKGVNVVESKESQTVDVFEFMKSNFEDAAKSNGTVIISAAGGKEFALENATYANGLFTYALLQCLQNRNGDKDKNGIITVQELKDYLLDSVPLISDGRQQPTVRRENNQNDWEIR